MLKIKKLHTGDYENLGMVFASGTLVLGVVLQAPHG